MRPYKAPSGDMDFRPIVSTLCGLADAASLVAPPVARLILVGCNPRFCVHLATGTPSGGSDVERTIASTRGCRRGVGGALSRTALIFAHPFAP